MSYPTTTESRVRLQHAWDHPDGTRLEAAYCFKLRHTEAEQCHGGLSPPDGEQFEAGPPLTVELTNYDAAGNEVPATNAQIEFAIAYFWNELAVDVSRLRESVEV